MEFARHDTTPRWRCGTECNGFVIVDSRRGKAYDGFGVAGLTLSWVAKRGGDDAMPRMEFSPDSRLLKIDACRRFDEPGVKTEVLRPHG